MLTLKLENAMYAIVSAIDAGDLASGPCAPLTASRYEWRIGEKLRQSAIGAAMPPRFREWLRGRLEATYSLETLEREKIVRFEHRAARLPLLAIEALDISRLTTPADTVWHENALRALRALCTLSVSDGSVLETYRHYAEHHGMTSAMPGPVACARRDLAGGVWQI